MNTSIIPSLAWALFHSVWELMLIAVLLSILLRFIPGRRASLRFLLSYGGLMLGFTAVFMTFCWYYIHSDPGFSPFGDGTIIGFQFENTPLPDQALMGQSLFEYLEFWVLENSQLITLIWGLGILMLSLFYGFGFLWTQIIRRYRVQEIPAGQQAFWQHIYSLSGISKYIEIKQSLLVKGPFTVGHVKPIILVPVGFFTMLSPSQVEAILLHELAHIRRHDYLLNLIQMMVKLVLFYHPATWFICRCIDTEREHACDDLAMSTFADPKAYVRALGLIRIQFFNQKNQWAMQFSKQEPDFIKRLKRLMNPLQEQGSKRSFLNLFLPILLIGLGAIFVSFKSAKDLNAQLPGVMIDGPHADYPVPLDTIIPEKEKFPEKKGKTSTEKFPETDKKSNVVVGVQNISKEDEEKQKELAEARANLRDAQRMLEIEKLQIEANQARIYDQYELGKLNEVEKNDAIQNLKESYKNLLQTEMNLKESQNELKSAYREAYGLNSERSDAERELRIIEGRARDLEREQERVLRGYLIQSEKRAKGLQRESEMARREADRLVIVEGRLQEEAQARIRERAESERMRGEVMKVESQARERAERARIEGIISAKRSSESFPVRLKRKLVKDGLAKDNNKKVKIRIENNEIYVQGKKLEGGMKAKYIVFFEREDIDMNYEHLIEIKTNSFTKSSTKTETN